MMELVAMHLKQRGALVSRALSFKSCTFELVNDVMTPSRAASLFIAFASTAPAVSRVTRSRRWRLRESTPSPSPHESLRVS